MIALCTDDPMLRELFAYARGAALAQLVQGGRRGPLNVSEHTPDGTGTVRYEDAYAAGYSHRSGYYLRDLVHQAVGAHLLGLEQRTGAMIRSFVRSANAGHRGWPAWAMNFDRRTPLAIDYRGPDDFVRELPAVFELIEAIHLQYRWTAAPGWLDEAAFAHRTVSAFVAQHDLEPRNGVAKALGAGIFEGTASYNELPGTVLREAGDGYAAQFAATAHAAALVLAAGGDGDGLRDRARRLQGFYRETWSRHPSGAVVCGWTSEGEPVLEWSRESTWFPLLKGLLADERTDAELDRVDRLCRDPRTAPRNIEALTYLPDLFFRQGRPETAWAWMQRIYRARDEPHEVALQGRNGSYPEVPFTLLSQIALGIVGMEADAPRRRLSLRTGLPTGIGFVELADVPFGDGVLTVEVSRGGARVQNLTGAGLAVHLVDAPGYRDPHLSEPDVPGFEVAAGDELRLARR